MLLSTSKPKSKLGKRGAVFLVMIYEFRFALFALLGVRGPEDNRLSSRLSPKSKSNLTLARLDGMMYELRFALLMLLGLFGSGGIKFSSPKPMS